jgi:hypothetical protein
MPPSIILKNADIVKEENEISTKVFSLESVLLLSELTQTTFRSLRM